MKNSQSFIACDLGAGSGRVILGTVSDGRVEIEEIHRFGNYAVRLPGSLHWDTLAIYEELKAGLRKLAARPLPIASLSVDSWGVDYVIIGKRNPQLGVPFNYRDARTDATFNACVERVGRDLIFEETGIQFMQLNTLYQLAAEDPAILSLAERVLLIGDYFNFLFSGTAVAERSLASTTQIYNPRLGDWSARLIAEFGFPPHIFPKIVPSGTQLGPMLPEITDETGLSGIEIIATCSHDTGAAVAAVPAEGDDWAFLSSGTWSLIGVELPEPLINPQVRSLNYTNEAGYEGRTRFLKNIIGLWLLQECQREWALEGKEFSHQDLIAAASGAEAFRSLVNPNDPRFLKPGRMPAKIAEFCQETGQHVPRSPGEFVRCILESLALLYALALSEIEHLTARKITRFHIVGGGSLNSLLNRFAAEATGRTVLAGPVEATAVGNILIQARTMGLIGSFAGLREIVRASFPIEKIEPRDPELWRQAHARFERLRARI